ncbi:UvrD-helicase domain-containing protein [Pseudomonas syringae]|uniref:UvrD-helicase domain-containing protein n=1 Tax=Pseudomonas syringae TaxID=317 RepID=UPI00061A8C46|nr:UvrD-helicase domain-containing protein [Pseudomonas syringae]MBS7415260.1 ATP-dependent helicase [Pseudomonas syringae]
MNKDISDPDEKIKCLIDAKINFSVIAGAGSGKTESLLKALSYVSVSSGAVMLSANQKVACITYTNAAVDVIKRRTSLSELFYVSTIHKFLWEQINSYQNDIRISLRERIIPKRIENKQEKTKGNSKIAIKARAQIVRLAKALASIDNIKFFKYGSSGYSDLEKGQFDHDDVIEIASDLIINNKSLRRIIGQRFPYIFIDEAQDTFPSVIEAFNSISGEIGLPITGYFGDPVQQIYEKRAGDFQGPPGACRVEKGINYRCSVEVIKVLNAIRPSLPQEPGDKNVQGSVELILIKSEKGEGERNTYSTRQLNDNLSRFDQALESVGWKGDSEVKQLYLTRQMIAVRLGFSRLNKLFTGLYSSKSSEDSFKEGTHYLISPFVDTLVPLINYFEADNWGGISALLRERSPALDPEGKNKNKSLRDVSVELRKHIEGLNQLWKSGTTYEVLLFARDNGLFNSVQKLDDHLSRMPRLENYDDDVNYMDKADWLCDEFFKLTCEELNSFCKFINKMTAYSTQHGVKGDEFPKVLVVFDDVEANWNQYSFSKLFAPKTSGKDPTDGQRTKSYNIAYVCFSRASEDLKIVIFSNDPEAAKKEIELSFLFVSARITLIT